MSLKAYLYDYSSPMTPIELNDLFLIGKDPFCNLSLKDESLEERHARIECKGYAYLIRDLRSNLGTFVNELPVTEAYLHEGDVLKFGQYSFLFSIHQKNQSQGIGMTSKNMGWDIELSSLGNVAKTEFPVLLMGPSGAGKEIIASALHQHSFRSRKPYIIVNCSALSETLVESELFGHIKGSFTGATSDRRGAFEMAHGGTLFLDEIGDLPYSMQAKLLRAIENQEIRPLGSEKTVKVNVRIIAATHHDLRKKAQSGEFRADLLYRLNVITITPPALKDRMEDFDDLLNKFCRQYKVRISTAALDQLKQHTWPGNIRELKNFVSRASAYFPNTYIEEGHLSKLLDVIPITNVNVVLDKYKETRLPSMKALEKELIIKRLTINLGNQRKTSEDLGLPKSTLHDRLRLYGINPKDFQQQEVRA